MDFSKSAVLLANEHQSDQKKMLQMIFVKNFAMYSFTQKRRCQLNIVRPDKKRWAVLS